LSEPSYETLYRYAITSAPAVTILTWHVECGRCGRRWHGPSGAPVVMAIPPGHVCDPADVERHTQRRLRAEALAVMGPHED
jgi:hypothetical protein